MPDTDFEKLGTFYLGRGYDLEARARTENLLLYDSRDLVTHAVCIGMTGSGKTGLCLTILEEAAIDGIPAIVVDPKGDLANLLLTFPGLSPEEFQPWISEDEARRKGLSPSEHAAAQAELWRTGLAQWGQDGSRIQRLRDSADFAVYTPGSGAGLPVSVLKSFDAPSGELLEDREVFGERVSSTATGLLGLLGIDADPLQSREHILLSTIFATAWERGENLDLAGLIRRVQSPDVDRVGVVDVETFFPSSERFAFAMRMNNLMASPGFSRWLEGEPLDVGAMLHTPAGRPRVSIFSIAHLSEPERMFFVSMLLNHTLEWVRTQSGTGSLRAMLFMDEIAGYVPPVANPPSKRPLLTLMKQARAYGFGVVLATQNPVDLDYKGLSNAGTWFIGRLQTDQDKQRVLDGLEGAASGAGGRFDRRSVDAMLSRLGSRVFLMNNIHEDGPVVFETRWALSYLRGPLTRDQLRRLTEARRTTPAPTEVAEAPAPRPSTAPLGAATARPVLPPEVPQYFIPPRTTAARGIIYRPMVLGCARVYYHDSKAGLDAEVPACYLAAVEPGPVAIDWQRAEPTNLTESEIEHEPVAPAAFSPLPSEAVKPRSFDAWKKSLADTLFRTHRLELLASSAFKLHSRAKRLRAKYAPKVAALQEKLRRARAAVEAQQAQARSTQVSTAISLGAALLSAFTGRKAASAGSIGRAATAARSASRSAKESSDVHRARDNVASVEAQLNALDEQFRAEMQQIIVLHDPASEPLTTIAVKPRKSNITVRAVVLAWAPYATGPDGAMKPAWL